MTGCSLRVLVVLLLEPLDDVTPLSLVGFLSFFIFSVGHFRGFRWTLIGWLIDWRCSLLGWDPPCADDGSRVSRVIGSLLGLIDEVVGHDGLRLRSVRLLHLAVGSALVRLRLLHMKRTSVFLASHPRPWDIRACALQLAL